ncbi:MAG: M48 family metallopeptidase [Deltaproteobacteria bacterium]|nr:M48 family metallopeptidase [Deltaproteobacteria bacterium]
MVRPVRASLLLVPSAVSDRTLQDERGGVNLTWAGACTGGVDVDGPLHPVALVDYVVAHELVHLSHEDHSRAFWAALGRVMPDHEERKRRLRAMGPRLVW